MPCGCDDIGKCTTHLFEEIRRERDRYKAVLDEIVRREMFVDRLIVDLAKQALHESTER